MIQSVVGEKNYPLRIPPDLYARAKQLGEERSRSVNYVLVRLIRLALEQDAEAVDKALR